MDSLKALLIVGCLATATAPALQSAEPVSCGSCTSCGKRICCPHYITIKEKRHCWIVECKEICIPAVQWKGCLKNCCLTKAFRTKGCGSCGKGCTKGCHDCQLRCGKVRVVHVLKKKEFEVERCGCKWEFRCVADGCGSTLCTDCLNRGIGTSPKTPIVPAPGATPVPQKKAAGNAFPAPGTHGSPSPRPAIGGIHGEGLRVR